MDKRIPVFIIFGIVALVVTMTAFLVFVVGSLAAIAQAAPDDIEDFIDYAADAGVFPKNTELENELLDGRAIVLTSDFNAVSGREIITKLLVLESRDSSRPIDLYLRSEGGWESDLFAIVDTMDSIAAPVNVHALGEVHSAGLMLLVAATGERLVYPNTILGFHSLDRDELDEMEARYLRHFETHADLPKEWLSDRSYRYFYMTPDEALSFDAADRLVKPTRKKEP